MHQAVYNLHRVKGRLKRMAGVKQPNSGDKPEQYIHPNTWLHSGSREYVLGVLSHAEARDSLLNMNAVRRLVNDHMSGKRHEYQLICGLMTLIIWHKQFVEGAAIQLDSKRFLSIHQNNL